jgi:hypothetical protein
MAELKRTRKTSIARLLRKETDTEIQKVTKAIDKALEKDEISVGAFSVIGIRRACTRMLDALDDFDRRDFFGAFFDLYNLCMAPDIRAKGVFHPSSLKSACPRSLVYDLQNAPRDASISPVSGALQRTFDVGSWYHLYIQNILLNIGFLEQAEVPVICKERFINGKADGVFRYEVFGEKVVLEIKTMNDMVYQRAIFKPFEKHEFQASLYARELGATKILYLYINKNTSAMKEFLMPLNMPMLEQADKIMSSTISHVGAGTLPKRACPDALCENAFACPYRTHCFKE